MAKRKRSKIRAGVKRVGKRSPKKHSRKKVVRKVGARRRKAAPKKKATRKKAVTRKKPVKRKRTGAKGLHPVKYIERTERVMAGHKRRRKRKKTTRSRRRRVSGEGGGSSGLLMGLAIGGLGLYLLTRSSTTTQTPANLPPITQTANPTRNSQSSDLVNYAMAAGLTISAIASLINTLNNLSDDDVNSMYNNMQLGGGITAFT